MHNPAQTILSSSNALSAINIPVSVLSKPNDKHNFFKKNTTTSIFYVMFVSDST